MEDGINFTEDDLIKSLRLAYPELIMDIDRYMTYYLDEEKMQDNRIFSHPREKIFEMFEDSCKILIKQAKEGKIDKKYFEFFKSVNTAFFEYCESSDNIQYVIFDEEPL